MLASQTGGRGCWPPCHQDSFHLILHKPQTNSFFFWGAGLFHLCYIPYPINFNAWNTEAKEYNLATKPYKFPPQTSTQRHQLHTSDLWKRTTKYNMLSWIVKFAMIWYNINRKLIESRSLNTKKADLFESLKVLLKKKKTWLRKRCIYEVFVKKKKKEHLHTGICDD